MSVIKTQKQEQVAGDYNTYKHYRYKHENTNKSQRSRQELINHDEKNRELHL